jgi:hypothetical protein
MDPEVALENVAYARAHNSEHQNELLKMAAVSDLPRHPTASSGVIVRLPWERTDLIRGTPSVRGRLLLFGCSRRLF